MGTVGRSLQQNKKNVFSLIFWEIGFSWFSFYFPDYSFCLLTGYFPSVYLQNVYLLNISGALLFTIYTYSSGNNILWLLSIIYIFPVYIPQNTEETEAQRSQGTGPESHSQQAVEPEFKFQSPCLEPLAILPPSFFLWHVLRFRAAKRILKHTQ